MKVKIKEVDFVQYLSDGRWHFGKDIAKHFGVPLKNLRDHLRPMDVYQNGELISCPGKGYKLTEMATKKEINDAYWRMVSRANEIMEHADALHGFV